MIYIDYEWSPITGTLRPSLIRQPMADSDRRLAEFRYGPVTDAAWQTSYRDKLLQQQQEVLKSISSYPVDRNNPLKTYFFEYALDPATHIPNLATLQECETSSCLPTVRFTYSGAAAPQFAPTVESAVLDWGREDSRQWVDFNGDGRVDFCRVVDAAGARLACTLSAGAGFGSTLSSDVLDPGVEGSRKWLDVNADGFADFCRVTDAPGAYALTCTLGGTVSFGSTVSSAIDAGTEMQNAKWYDTRRDGRMRFCRYDSNSEFRCAVLSGSAFVDEAGVAGAGSGKFELVDVIGKAMPYRCSRTQASKWLCIKLDASKQFEFGTNLYQGWWADINGDGHTDYCQLTGTTGTATMQCGRALGTETTYLGQGRLNFESLVSVTGANVIAGLAENAKWVDVNGDNGKDYCRVIGAPGGYRAACSVSKNNGFRDAFQSDILDPGQSEGQDWIDFSGTNSKSFCRVIGSTNMVDSRLACTPLAVSSSRLVQIESGIGTSTKIGYKPITDSSVYTKGSGAIYPLMDLQEPVYVVSTLDLDNGRGGYVSTSYRYGGAVKDVTGRGGMGVAWGEETNVASGAVTRSEYRQDIPFTGLLARSAISLADRGNNGLLSEIIYEYGCKDFVSATGCTVVQEARYFPYLAKTTSKSWSPNGAALPTITATQEFDNWGSVTHSKRAASDGIQSETINTYKNIDTPQLWMPGLLEKSVITKSAPAN